MVAILNFRIFRKNHKNACILKTVLDRVILAKFLIHRVSVKTEIFDLQVNSAELVTQFSKIFCPAKNGSHFEFSNFLQNYKTQKCFYLEIMQDRAIWAKFLPTGYL